MAWKSKIIKLTFMSSISKMVTVIMQWKQSCLSSDSDRKLCRGL